MKNHVVVVITSYNKADTIKRAIDSVLAQTYKHYKIIVVDDGSTDNTLKIIQPYKQIITIKTKHHGMMKAFEAGFNFANLMVGENHLIATLDADDYWPDKNQLKNTLKLFQKDVGLVASTLTGEQTITYDSLLKKNPIVSSTICFRATLFHKLCPFHSWLNLITQDYPILLSFAKHSQIKTNRDPFKGYNFQETSYMHTKSRGRKTKLVFGILKIKLHFIRKYGCKPSTLIYVIYRLLRDIYSIVFKRWYK